MTIQSGVVDGAIPKNYIPAVQAGVREALDHGLVAGFPASDVKVTVFDGSYHDVDSNEQAFKMAGMLAMRAAAEAAKPVILEPILSVAVDVPEEHVGDVVGDLNSRRGRLLGVDSTAGGKSRIRANVPMASMARYALDLRSITKGRGRFSQSVSHYEEVPHEVQRDLVNQWSATHSHGT